MIRYEELNEKFLISIFPEFEEEIRNEVEWIGEFLPHCVFANVLNPKVIELLKRDDFYENELLHKIFRMYEDFAVNGDEETQNLLQVSLLENLWDEKITYERAMKIMSSGTKDIWDYIHNYIFIPADKANR